MQRSLLLAALVGAIACAPAAAFAMDSGGAMSGAHDSMMSASTMWVCHPTASGEKASAMTADGKQHLTCKTIDMNKMMAGPAMSGTMSAADTDKAWKAFLHQQFTGESAR